MIGQKISNYKILEKLGGGGMGVVYKAQDLVLDRFVALKFLPSDLSADEEGKKRLVHEARAASALDHPNICTIYEVDETEDGRMFIVMAYCDGVTLKQKIETGSMPLDQVIDIAIQAAEGLARAHEMGITHRDIKSANLMITNRGKVKIVDFGLAQLAGQTGLGNAAALMGTPAYMSPEQARAEEVDHRTDIWSLAVALYEMATGQLPFTGEYEQEVVYSILNEDPAPITSLRSDIPPELERIIRKGLKKKASARYQRMDEMLNDLRPLRKLPETSLSKHERVETGQRRKRAYLYSGVAALLALMILQGFLSFTGNDEAMVSLAILPIANAEANPELEYLGDGITESLINSLSQLPTLKVIAFTSVMRYKGKEIDPHTVGRDLDVHAVLVGRVLQHGNNLSISVALVDARNNRQLWGEKYNRKLADILAVQEEITQEISRSLQLRLYDDEQKRLAKHYTENPEAYQLYLKGRYFWNKRTAEGLTKGIAYFEQAIEKDPAYALAYTGLADCYTLRSIYDGLPPNESFPKAKAAAMIALEIDENLAEAHASLAMVRFYYDWNWLEAEREFKQALALNPGYATAFHWYAYYLIAMGRVEEAMAAIKHAQELEPLSLIINTDVGDLFYLAHRYDQATEQLQKTLEMDSSFVVAHWLLGFAYGQKSMFAQALVACQKANALSAGSALTLGTLGHAYALSGKCEEAQAIIGELKKMAKRNYVSPYHLAIIYAGLGEKEQALAWLQGACDERSSALVFLKAQPIFDGLRSDPRFMALLMKMGLEKSEEHSAKSAFTALR
jgi:eukaryotic-like serine/threonine-protein kinase